MAINNNQYVSGQVFAVLPRSLDREQVSNIITVEYGLTIVAWTDSGISDELQAVVVAVPLGKENWYANGLGNHGNIPVTGCVRVTE